ncbi:MAG TPA: hypothetical protein DCL77_18105 [Prolixibacteraceae bacterium]|nr:hypothetical protein [Prolixibacteraceae bacterium]
MRSYLLIILILVGFTLSAQTYHPFPSKNTLWTERVTSPTYDGYSGFHCFALKDSDTIINRKIYHKLYHSTDTVFTEAKLCGGIREQNRRVYFYAIDSIPYLGMLTFPSKKTETILFDFSLKLGDIIRPADSFRVESEYKVTKVDSTLTGAGYRRTISFGYSDGYTIPWAQWVEGVGGLRGLLFVTGDVVSNGTWNDLVCIRQENNWIYHLNKYSSCFYGYTAIDEIKTDDVSVSPNPVDAQFKITFPLGYIRIQIVNMFGIVVRDFDIAGQTSTTINKEGLPAGVYFVNLTDGNKRYSTIKVVFR